MYSQYCLSKDLFPSAMADTNHTIAWFGPRPQPALPRLSSHPVAPPACPAAVDRPQPALPSHPVCPLPALPSCPVCPQPALPSHPVPPACPALSPCVPQPAPPGPLTLCAPSLPCPLTLCTPIPPCPFTLCTPSLPCPHHLRPQPPPPSHPLHPLHPQPTPPSHPVRPLLGLAAVDRPQPGWPRLDAVPRDDAPPGAHVPRLRLRPARPLHRLHHLPLHLLLGQVRVRSPLPLLPAVHPLPSPLIPSSPSPIDSQYSTT